MDRRRPAILPGIRHRCRSCGLLVRRHRGFDEELATDTPHQCGEKRSTWDVLPPVRESWLRRLALWVAGRLG